MNTPTTAPTLLKLDAISEAINELRHELAHNETANQGSVLGERIHSLDAFGSQLNTRRKALGIELATLELQTGVSISTLKRLFKDPTQVKFSTVYSVCSALGIKLCAVR
ncbi:helix-turn-helix domain-containing protein [Pectobacterium punjabense]|uniref:Helix-turn-helix domain-containing protein n=1 Tax=Pectobacterium punjabense TaxID=2108399 RepID=A0ABX6L7G0_9GAMM|nr:helix-turn-helix domain-containing protein [Pectobacterium punjabense]MBS4431500.1 helix-turn-helix domain-containing protein [Pectobacterium punjabense]PTA64209.1 transcriptional regulator [Pectobacterium punjabense]QJA22249.1 helix-turn-helix domain-containing protein [Pectobacterium punjabense]